MITDLLAEMEKAIFALNNTQGKEIWLYHHNDTDGISSSAILNHAFYSVGYKTYNSPLEKPYPQVIEKIFESKDKIIVFTDFAGKIAPLISRLNNGRNLVIILDHHPAKGIDDNKVFVLDGEIFGIKGDRDISASGTCYLFSKLLLEKKSDSHNLLPHLGVLGAIGDGFYVNGKLSGINRDILKEAEESGEIRIEANHKGENYYIKLGGKEYAAEEVCKIIDILGGVGYYENGSQKGRNICMQGISSEILEYSQNLTDIKNKIFTNEIKNIKKNLTTTENIQWIDVKNRFSPMGIKMIGVFLTEIKDADFLDHTKYLAGFQQIPNHVPGFGEINFVSTKISMRVSEYLTEKIRNNEMPGLNSFLPDATEAIGGFSDACHRLSAATTVKIGQEAQLIDEVEKILGKIKDK